MSDLLCQGDLEICARTVYGEARGESHEGRVAVARVMVNRWRSTTGQWAKDDTLASACLRHLQFSGWTPADPNFQAQYKASLGDAVFLGCWLAVLEALMLTPETDPTQGALHYHADWIEIPKWVPEGHQPCIVIGRHRFYNSIP